MVDKVRQPNLSSIRCNNNSAYSLTGPLVRDSNHGGIHHDRMAQDRFLDLKC